VGGEGKALISTGAVDLDEPGPFQTREQLVRCLPGDEDPSGEVGVGQAGPLRQQLKAGVLGDAEIELP